MKYYLAPMEGITGRIFRKVYHACFTPMDKYFAPFITPKNNGGLSPKDYQDIARENNQGLTLVPQILTNQAEGFIQTAKTLKELGFTEVNLNLGCPSGTVVSKGRGAGFLAFPKELDQFLWTIFSETKLKISIKTRLGKEREEEFEKLLEIYNQYPLEELIIHPRVREDYYQYPIRMDGFQKGFSRSANPVCYNGDIFTASDYRRLTKQYPSLERVMIGRGMVMNPGLLDEIQRGIPLGIEAIKEFHDRLYHSYQEFFLPISGERVVLFKMKEIWSYMIAGFPENKKWKKKIEKAQTLKYYEDVVSALFQRMKSS